MLGAEQAIIWRQYHPGTAFVQQGFPNLRLEHSDFQSHRHSRGGSVVDDIGLAVKRAARCLRAAPDIGGHVGLRRDGVTQI